VFSNSNSHYETDLGVFSAKGAENTQIGFLKARQRRAFKKPIFIMRVIFSTVGAENNKIVSKSFKTKGVLCTPFVYLAIAIVLISGKTSGSFRV
jgi:hypothetical protein